MARPKKDRPDPPKRTRKPKQGYLDPDMAPPSIPELDMLAEKYVAARDARMAMGLTEVDAGNQLLAEMQTRRLAEYEYDGKLVKVENLTKIKVRKNKEASEEGGDE